MHTPYTCTHTHIHTHTHTLTHSHIYKCKHNIFHTKKIRSNLCDLLAWCEAECCCPSVVSGGAMVDIHAQRDLPPHYCVTPAHHSGTLSFLHHHYDCHWFLLEQGDQSPAEVISLILDQKYPSESLLKEKDTCTCMHGDYYAFWYHQIGRI